MVYDLILSEITSGIYAAAGGMQSFANSLG